jgi:TetR/AcrR family transcriptional repressor of nem operon
MTKHCRDDIICAGEAILLEKSYFALGISEVLAAVGVPKGSFYHFFRSKEDFGTAVIDHFASQQEERLKQILLSGDGPASERLLRFFQMNLEAHEKNRARMICVVAKLACEVSNLSPAMAEALSRGIRGWLSVFTACIREGQESGDIKTAMEPEKAAEWMYDTWNGALARMQVSRDTSPLSAALDRFRWLLEKGS